MTDNLRALIADDAYAMSFQTIGQYRSALLKAAKQSIPSQSAQAEAVATLRVTGWQTGLEYAFEPDDDMLQRLTAGSYRLSVIAVPEGSRADAIQEHAALAISHLSAATKAWMECTGAEPSLSVAQRAMDEVCFEIQRLERAALHDHLPAAANTSEINGLGAVMPSLPAAHPSAREAALEKALRACAGVLGGFDMTKAALIDALAAARAALGEGK